MRSVPLSATCLLRHDTSATPLVLLHGLGGDRRQMLDLAWGKRTLGRLVVAPDQRGHGQTPLGPAETPTFDGLAADVFATLDGVGAARSAIVLGISMGAAVAAAMAVARPERVAALVLVRPAWHWADDHENLDVFTVLAEHLDAEDPGSSRQRFARSPAYLRHEAANPAFASGLLAHFAATNRQDLARMMRHLPRSRPVASAALVAAIGCPALVIGANDDPVHPLAIAERWADALPSAELELAPPRYASPDQHALAVTTAVERFETAW